MQTLLLTLARAPLPPQSRWAALFCAARLVALFHVVGVAVRLWWAASPPPSTPRTTPTPPRVRGSSRTPDRLLLPGWAGRARFVGPCVPARRPRPAMVQLHAPRGVWVAAGPLLQSAAAPRNPGANPANAPPQNHAHVEPQPLDADALAATVERQRLLLGAQEEALNGAMELARRASLGQANFLRTMSHELRTPLTAMGLHIRLLEKNSALSAGGKQALAGIARSSQRLLDMVDTVLEYARLEAGRFQPQMGPITLGELARDVLAEHQSHADQKGIALHAQTAQELPPLHSDARVLRLVVVNLVGNAVKFTTTGTVSVLAGFEDGAHSLVVTDTGAGLGSADLLTLFDGATLLADAHHGAGQGSGLGLSMVKDMVHALGGTIHAASQVGVGSTFTVRFPERATTPAESATHNPDDPIRGA